MMQIKYRYFLFFYFIAAMGILYAEVYEADLVYKICKPLLCLLLAAYFYLNTKMQTLFERFIIYGLGFSFLGDVLLMFQSEAEWYFILGLGAFLITHFMYLKAFLYLTSIPSGYLAKNKWLIYFCFIFFLVNVFFYWPHLPKGMGIPVVCYCFAICLMLMGCIHSYGSIPGHKWRLIFIGVLLFIVSNSLIALTKFVSIDMVYNGLWIMLTYMLSQLLITYGSLKATKYCRYEAQDSISSKF